MLELELAQLKLWVQRDLTCFCDADKLLRTLVKVEEPGRGTTRIVWTLWTRRNRYTVQIGWRADLAPYFGMGATTRSWRAGEDWHRGRDLPDGHFNEETWRAMLNALISYELDEPVAPQQTTGEKIIEIDESGVVHSKGVTAPLRDPAGGY